MPFLDETRSIKEISKTNLKMPFQADTRCPFVSIKFNVSAVCEDLETILDKDYNEDINEGSIFWEYVEFLEDEFSGAYSRDPNLNFWEWLPDNYDTDHRNFWCEIEKNFKDRDEDTSDDEEDTPEPMPEWMKKWILEQFKAIEEGELDLEKTKEFLEFVHERKDSHYIQDLFKEHMDIMKKNLNK